MRTGFLSIFWIFLRLGFTSFGGPVAHLGYFRAEFVERRKWLEDHSYADLVALCQVLPGPASSQVGIALGLGRGGLLGAVAAWTGFTLPSALLLALLGMGLTHIASPMLSAGLHGLKIAAVAVVAQAILSMGKSLCPDRLRATMAVAAAIIALMMPFALTQVGVIFGGAVFGLLALPVLPLPQTAPVGKLNSLQGAACLALFLVLLVALPLIAAATRSDVMQQGSQIYRVGAMVFGGGHLVLPLLQAEVVPRWLTNDTFLAGYGAAQAIPGPLFAFAAYVGAATAGLSWVRALVCLAALFLPGFLLIVGILPFWERLRGVPSIQTAIAGINAAVVGLLIAAFFDPVWTTTIRSRGDFALAAAAFAALVFWKTPPWMVVAGCAVGGWVLAQL